MNPESLNSLAKELRPHIDLILLCNAHALSRALSYFFRFLVYVWTDRNDSHMLHVDAIFLKNGEKTHPFKKYLRTCAQSLTVVH